MTKSRDVKKEICLTIWTQCQRIKIHGILRLYTQHIKLHSKWKVEKGKVTHLGGSSVKALRTQGMNNAVKQCNLQHT